MRWGLPVHIGGGLFALGSGERCPSAVRSTSLRSGEGAGGGVLRCERCSFPAKVSPLHIRGGGGAPTL